jgi:multisubunit Na+/H+ antiporter MnhE subunit
MMRRLGIALLLLLRFLWEVARSGLTTAWLIVRPGKRPEAELVRMRYRGLSEAGVVVLGCMITLTPGTTIIDVDPARGELLLHLLDAGDATATIAGIRRRFEAPLARLFPAREPAREPA